MKLKTRMGGINVFGHKFLFFRYYQLKIQFLVSFEYPSQVSFSATGVVKYSKVQILP